MKVFFFIALSALIITSCSKDNDSALQEVILNDFIESAYAGPVWKVEGNLSKFPACGRYATAISENSNGSVNVKFSLISNNPTYYDSNDNPVTTSSGEFFTYGSIISFTKVTPYLWKGIGLNGVEFEARYRLNCKSSDLI